MLRPHCASLSIIIDCKLVVFRFQMVEVRDQCIIVIDALIIAWQTRRNNLSTAYVHFMRHNKSSVPIRLVGWLVGSKMLPHPFCGHIGLGEEQVANKHVIIRWSYSRVLLIDAFMALEREPQHSTMDQWIHTHKHTHNLVQLDIFKYHTRSSQSQSQ